MWWWSENGTDYPLWYDVSKRHWIPESTSSITTLMLFTDHVILCEPVLNCPPSCGTIFLCPFYITTHHMRVIVWLVLRNVLLDEVHIWMVHFSDKVLFGCVIVCFLCHEPRYLQNLLMITRRGYWKKSFRAGGLYGRILTEVVSTDQTRRGLKTRPRSLFLRTDRLSSANKMFIIWELIR